MDPDDAIVADRRNYRIHSAENLKAIQKSLKDCGAGRSILIDKNNEIIAGNGCYDQASKLGIPVKIIETDGTELIALKRTDLDYDDKKRKKLAIMDNSTTDLSQFDYTTMLEDFDQKELVEFSVLDPTDFDESAKEAGEESDELTKDDISEDNPKYKAIAESFNNAAKHGTDTQEYGYYLCVCFQSVSQKLEFLTKIGSPETKYDLYIDGQVLADSLGVEIAKNDLKPLQPHTEQQLKDLAME